MCAVAIWPKQRALVELVALDALAELMVLAELDALAELMVLVELDGLVELAELVEVTGAGGFEPHGLPDSSGAGIEDAAALGLPVLLAARDVAVFGRVFGADGEYLGADAGEEIGDIELNGDIAAFVLADEATVDPDHGAIVDGAEVEQDAAVGPVGGELDGAAVPDPGVETGVADAGELGFEGVGDGDLAGQRFFTGP